ncbi:S-layer homology domain-containing protein [Peptoniphilus equinus]|uniref:S-layer homology domain-containing protein n=1 Tax=Peptoniphilus equinus TaxID=3016343 RepID=A0ABY7QWG2_9FIRM|nr:S-layer homology domain-containing protein [Peptoniphilus equinus]WBW50610.1 S-layer homology domain-containing protein [Peptoniphilus equinus]
MNKIHRVLAIGLASASLLQGPVFAKTFSDVSKDGQFQWIYNELNTLSDQGVFGGYPEGDFRPQNPVSFLEVMKVIYNLKKPSATEVDEAMDRYRDFLKAEGIPAWAQSAMAYVLNNNTVTEATVRAAKERGFLKTDKPVYPDRNSVAVYFGRAFGLKGDGTTDNLKHKDLDKIPPMTIGYLSDLVDVGIFSDSGSEGYFNGSQYLRRAEMIAIAAKALTYLSRFDTGELVDVMQENPQAELLVPNEGVTTNHEDESPQSDVQKSDETLQPSADYGEVSGIVESVNANERTIQVDGKVFTYDSTVNLVGYNGTDMLNLSGARITLNYVGDQAVSIRVHSYIVTD